eukprot:comp22440_c0_seq1/m.55092 comp22440_c0_seq1/g.55092  ORF comp22440_c0_seq1/g.55092 comp22440_c0_seq1/m.55092 type:complete len:302 (-) comp22440_c0_seq1:1664-2569(-)
MVENVKIHLPRPDLRGQLGCIHKIKRRRSVGRARAMHTFKHPADHQMIVAHKRIHAQPMLLLLVIQLAQLARKHRVEPVLGLFQLLFALNQPILRRRHQPIELLVPLALQMLEPLRLHLGVLGNHLRRRRSAPILGHQPLLERVRVAAHKRAAAKMGRKPAVVMIVLFLLLGALVLFKIVVKKQCPMLILHRLADLKQRNKSAVGLEHRLLSIEDLHQHGALHRVDRKSPRPTFDNHACERRRELSAVARALVRRAVVARIVRVVVLGHRNLHIRLLGAPRRHALCRRRKPGACIGSRVRR